MRSTARVASSALQLMQNISQAAPEYLKSLRSNPSSLGRIHRTILESSEQLNALASWFVIKEGGRQADDIIHYAKAAANLVELTASWKRPTLVKLNSYKEDVQDALQSMERLEPNARKSLQLVASH